MKIYSIKLGKRQRHVRRLSIEVLLQLNDEDNEYATLLNNTTIIKIASNDVNDYELEN